MKNLQKFNEYFHRLLVNKDEHDISRSVAMFSRFFSLIRNVKMVRDGARECVKCAQVVKRRARTACWVSNSWKRRIKIKICNFCLFCVLCIFYFCPLFCFFNSNFGNKNKLNEIKVVVCVSFSLSKVAKKNCCNPKKQYNIGNSSFVSLKFTA